MDSQLHKDDEEPDTSQLVALTQAFFARPTEVVARELLGKILVSTAGGLRTGGRIVETEAYLGVADAGSHAATKGMTERNKVMFGPPGRAYVYFTYGNHHMLNLVAHERGVAGAVLLRAVEPLLGLETMRARRGRPVHELTNGPGKLASALGLDLRDNDVPLGEGNLQVYDAPSPTATIGVSGRIGLSAGYELDLRYYIEGNAFVSKGRTGPSPVAMRRVAERGSGTRMRPPKGGEGTTR